MRCCGNSGRSSRLARSALDGRPRFLGGGFDASVAPCLDLVRGLPLAGMVTAVVVVDGPGMRPFDIGRGNIEDDPW